MERIEKLKAFLLANPHDSFVKHALALEMIKTGDDNEARKLFEQVLEHDPNYIGSYYHLAKLHERTGDPDAAAAWYEKGIAAAHAAGDRHALSELRAAYDELTGEAY